MSMCTYAGIHSSKLEYPLRMSRAAHCLPRHQTWAGYTSNTTHTDVHNIYTHHYNITLWLLLFDLDVSGNQSQSTYVFAAIDWFVWHIQLVI